MTTSTLPKFCWFCYRESIARVAAGLDPPMRQALLRAARQHPDDQMTLASEHARHPGVHAAPAVDDEDEDEDDEDVA